ncbi:hypothetical protein OKT23_17245 [Providencia rettgeri]|uniref:hypothetical protein n=1 Tax=Providencia TaxID=586 RepID=UPI00226FCDC7|nr:MULTISPECIES: hypothetical protein [Providencia]MCX9097011.1 hypothetical protein [Providencia rettgeri]MCX9126490.1 hypothetical protein [Providencia rettgeri]MCX9129862.1 hypothetical protein [Providencia rettgeri]HEM6846617.1 hypothetical protein [Providencia rettgeri]
MNINLEKAKLLYFSIKSQFYYSFPKRRYQTAIHSNYIISLTSYHLRLKNLHLTIESLLQQSLPPRNIYLWLSQEDIDKKKCIPDKILNLQKRGLIIKVKSENIRSYKKLSYIENILDLEPDITHVITADDDILYPHYWADSLIKKSKQHNCVSCFRGHNFIIEGDEYDYKKVMKNNISFDFPSYNLIPTGCSGIAYPRDSISPLVSKKNLFEHLSPNTDDIWYKAMTLSEGFQCSRVTKKNIHFPIILQSLSDSLFSKNINQNNNNLSLKKTIQHFKLETYFTL